MDEDKFFTEHSIKICKRCKGTGLYEWEELVDYHKGDYETHYKTCINCNGTGRLFKTKKWMIQYEPFDPMKLNKNIRTKLKND